MPILNDKEYKCDCCGMIFNLVNDETWNRNKAEEEYKKRFPISSMEDRCIVCDDCDIELQKRILG